MKEQASLQAYAHIRHENMNTRHNLKDNEKALNTIAQQAIGTCVEHLMHG